MKQVRTGKHQAETERAEAGKLQDHAIQELQAKVQELKTSNRELTENYEFKEMQLLESNASCDKARFVIDWDGTFRCVKYHLLLDLNYSKRKLSWVCFTRKRRPGNFVKENMRS